MSQLKNLEELEAARKEIKLPSFLSGLFMGKPRFDLISPYPEQTQKDKAIGDAFSKKVEEFLRRDVDPAKIERTAKIPDSVLKKMFELGIFGMKIPKKYGGQGFSQTNFVRILTLMGSRCSPIALTVSVHQLGATQILMHVGSEEQKEKYLHAFATQEVSAFALTAPSVGSDPAAMQTKVALNDAGSHYIIGNEEKMWTTNLPIAKHFAFFARIYPSVIKDKKPPITAFILDKDTPGITIKRCYFEGCRGVENAYSTYSEVSIPKENVLGRVDKGLSYALSDLNIGRINVGAICLGMVKQAWIPVLEWANFRKTFGKPIGEHQTQTMRIARMASNLFAMESILHLTSQLVDLRKIETRTEAAMAKVVCTEGAIQFLNDAQIIFSGRGYETADSKREHGEYAFPLEQLVRDVKMYRIGEGATDVMRPFIMREGLDLHLKKTEKFMSSGIIKKMLELPSLTRFYLVWYITQYFSKGLPGAVEHPKVKVQLEYVERTSRIFARKIFRLMIYTWFRHGKNAIDILQSKQGAISRMELVGEDLALIAITAGAAEYQECYHKRPEAWDLADQFFRDAKKRIEGNAGNLGSIIRNDDEETVAVGLKALKGHYNWLSEGAIQRSLKDYK